MFGGLAVRKKILIHGYSDSKATIRLLDLDTGKVKRTWNFGRGKRSWAEIGGISLDKDSNLYVADPEADIIRKFNLFGVSSGEIGVEKPSGKRVYWDKKGVLHHPNDVALDEHGNIFICLGDRPLVHGVQCFDVQGKYKFSLRAFGEPLEEWGLPMGITVSRNQVYIADTFNQCIQVFSLDGAFKMVFGVALEKGEKSLPVDVGILPNGDILVLRWKERPGILHFDSSGWFVRELVGPGKEKGKLFSPGAIEVGEGGRIYVLDMSGERIQEFDEDGKLIRVFE